MVTIAVGIVDFSTLVSGGLRDGYSFALSFTLPFMVFILLGSVLLSALVISPLKIANRVEKVERLLSPIQYEVNTEQILFKNQFTETKTDWGSFQKYIETEDVFLLIYSAHKGMFELIPKRAFASSEDEQTFKQLLISKNLKNKNSPLNIRGKPLFIIVIIALLCCFLYICVASFLYTDLRSA